MVIVDTSVWVQAYRDSESDAAHELASLLVQDQAIMVGPVLSELLAGARSEEEFEFLSSRLTVLHYVEFDKQTWIRHARLSAHLRKSGMKIGMADTAIACIALQHDLPIYSLDGDFDRVPNLRLHTAESA